MLFNVGDRIAIAYLVAMTWVLGLMFKADI